MSFNSSSPKFPILYQSDIKELGRIGPGSYQPYPNDHFLSHNTSQCVFNSSQERSFLKEESTCSPELGPGKYQIALPYHKFIIKSKVNGCQSAFKCKIDRFPTHPLTDPQTKQKDMAENKQEAQIYQCLLQTHDRKRMNGKLFGIRRDGSKINKTIPSIPSNQQSFGYRVDQKTKRLVQNQNPNVMLSRKILDKIDLNFFNTTNSMYNGSHSINSPHIKGPKWYKTPPKQPSPRSNPKPQQIFSQIKNSNCYPIQPQSPKKWLQKGNSINSKDERFKQNLGTNMNKNLLLLNSLKRKFGEYMNGTQNMQNILKQKQIESKNNCMRIEMKNRLCSPVECFLAKESRFVKQSKYYRQTQMPQQQQGQGQGEGQGGSGGRNIGGFGSKTNRFESNIKVNKKVGPGYYFDATTNKTNKKIRKGTKVLQNSQTQKIVQNDNMEDGNECRNKMILGNQVYGY